MTSQEGYQTSLVPWDPEGVLTEPSPQEIRYSRGFLRCRPEKWFPGFASQWLPLSHSLGTDIRIVEVQSLLTAPAELDRVFVGLVDDEPFGVALDNPASQQILQGIIPGAGAQSSEVALEYLARRVIGSLALAWSGPHSSVVKFAGEKDRSEVQVAGAVSFTFSINGNHCTLWFLLGPRLSDRFDGLWRRQIRSKSKQNLDALFAMQIEIAQLAVPPSMLGDYTRRGTVIDLEVPVSESIFLRVDSRPWLPARLLRVGNNLAFRIEPGPVSVAPLPQESTRVSVDFGELKVQAAELAELGQIGAITTTDIPLGSRVRLMVHNEQVANATLSSYEGRFAVSVE